MNLRDVLIDPARFWAGESPWEAAVAVIDLHAEAPWPDDLLLPPCPVVGIGSRDAPYARTVDLLIEPPITLESVLYRITQQPLACATLVQLLRLLRSLPLDEGLTAESFAYAMLQGSAEHRAWLSSRPKADYSPPGVLRVTRNERVLDLVMDRHVAGNAIDRTMRDELFAALHTAALDPSIERIVLRGAGRVFSLGADLAEFGTTGDPATAHAIRTVTLPARMAARAAEKLEVVVQGACVGAGLEIAAFARRIVATSRAWFQLPEVAMGVLPGAGGCVSLTRRIGRQRAALLMLSGRRLSARTALDWGLIDAIVDDLS